MSLIWDWLNSPSGGPDAPTWLVVFFRIFSAINFYCIVHVVLDQLVGKHLAKKFNLSFSERISVSEKVCSTINAAYVATAAIWISFVRDTFNVNDFVANVPCTSAMSAIVSIYPKAPATANFITSFFDMDWVLPAYVGYSIYDCVTMWFQGDNHWSMWVHHLVGIYGAFGNQVIRKLSILSNHAMMTEITAMTVNILWYAETLNPNRPKPRRASITTTMGDTTTDETPSLTPSASSETLNELSKATTATQPKAVKRKLTKPPATLLLVFLQTLRTLSFVVFRVTAVPYSFYLILSRGGATGVSFSSVWEMVVVVWNGCSSCQRGVFDWDFDRAIGFSALVVQMLFGLLNVVWTAVAIKVLRREVKGYLGRAGEKKKKAE
ncbi:hypothetical protein HDU79_008494 [Rhizoclosmatium sp. JEL0117]|nr:hypothetical protein HDU79_008494 [Rhizoclosmatium sp. JEL0117]